MDRNEFQTRLEMIDVLLKEQGWVVSDRSHILMEVDTKQSDFVRKSYKTVSDTLRNDMESTYVDYLLLDSFGAPLAIVEAKRTSKDPRLGQQQAAMYADDIKRQTGKDVFIFLSNGYQIIFWDRERYSPRDVKGFYTQGDLERLRFQKTQDATSPVEVDTSIVDRAKGIECVKRMVHLLQIGGKCGVIVPDGVLFGSSNAHKKLRQILLEQCQLEGIVSMPSGVFKPYAGVSTAVLVFTKGGSTDKVWFYDMDADGYSLDDKRTFIDGKGDIPNIIQHYRNRKKENPTDRKGKCFFVPISEIKENGYDLSISRYKEIEYAEVQYEKPEVIIEKIETLETEIQKSLRELKTLLKTK